MALNLKKLLSKSAGGNPRSLNIPKIIQKASGIETINVSYNIKKIDNEQQLVIGQVYAPWCLDSHGHYMTAEELKKTAYDFIANGMSRSIDVQHDNQLIDAEVVESFIARKDDPDGFEEGAWIASTRILDKSVWNEVKDGKLNGYSFEIMTYKRDTLVEIECAAWYYGFTDPDPYDKHTHPFIVRMDDNGEILWGRTGEGSDGSPSHPITKASITDPVDGKTHRIHLR
jgi:hypothetical protein